MTVAAAIPADDRLGSGADGGVAVRRVLVVEDEWFLAEDLVLELARAGMESVGPTGSIEEAKELIARERIDLALLDIAVDGGEIYDVADALVERGVPITFVSGYDANAIPARFAAVPRFEKPVAAALVVRALGRVAAD